ncbi:DUF3180 domain-containing protein [Bifidobacterium samirii]|uniref:DUF3180 domain-containing protein n=1 Tax=Bifidobacterium samirii TaxID=2306974 RepID=A0A430FWL3_9BIFI|nr:DUF3180 domain-containing protein [Bifidobacterium samirii]RSX58765.1 hypothetical protein D2E24_0061 [Bifidobacterium samirii]
MSAHRTPWWQYVLAMLAGLVGGMMAATYDERSGAGVLGAPWFVSALLLALGVTVLVLALQVHRYTTTDPRKRAELKPLDPQKAVSTLVLAKALGLAGAALVGWYGGQILLSVAHFEAEYYRQAVIECAVAAVVCLIDMVIGIVGEWLCQLPPMDGPESTAAKTRGRRRNMAQATAKTSH